MRGRLQGLGSLAKGSQGTSMRNDRIRRSNYAALAECTVSNASGDFLLCSNHSPEVSIGPWEVHKAGLAVQRNGATSVG
jgi:hypothetical protein